MDGHEKCGPRRPTRSGHSCNNARANPYNLSGMKCLTRAAAYGKMAAMVEGAALVRQELDL